MCRSTALGGRRCPSGNGSRRRTYQRARYALKAATRATVTTTAPPVPSSPCTTELPSPTAVSLVYRDPAKTRAEAGDVLTALRTSLPSSEWPGSKELEAYVSAAVTHGSVIRDNVAFATEQAWDEAGVSDAALQDLLNRKKAHAATRESHREHIDALIAKEERLKERFPNWRDDPDVAPTIIALGQEWSTLYDEWNNKGTEFNKELLRVNGTRRELFTAQVTAALAQERDLGGDPFVVTKSLQALSKSDREMFSEVVGNFPSGLIEFADSRGIPLHVKRSKKRAHYGGMVRQKRKEVRAGVLDAREALKQNNWWWCNMDYARLEDNELEDRHVPYRHTVESTPENRAALETAIEDWKDRQGNKRIPTGKVPVITEVEYAGERIPEKRLALHIPEAHVRMSDSSSTANGELTFSGPSSLAHEFGHHIEYNNPEVGMACNEFLKRRTEGMEKVVYQPAKRVGRRVIPAEVVTPDGFVDSYIGKHYVDKYHTEVFSMGVEALFTGECGGLLGIEVDTSRLATEGVTKRHRADPEHFALVMGLLAIANTSG